MKMTIDLNDPSSLDKAIAELDKFREELYAFAEELVDELANEGANIASVKFADAVYAGVNDAQPGRTAVEFNSRNSCTATVYVEGWSVLFIEFGTGIHKAEAPDEEAEIESGRVMSHGAYGLRQGENPYGWFYNGSTGANPPPDTEPADYVVKYGRVYGRPNLVHTYGNDANSSLYNSRLELEQKYSEIAKRVYERRFGG